MNRLLAFYAGSGPDHRGRYLRDIVRQDDRWLETTHDYVQWLFPLPEPSGVLPSAPTIDAEVAAAFAADEALRQTLRRSFLRMLSFYGLVVRDSSIAKGANWEERKADWFTWPHAQQSADHADTQMPVRARPARGRATIGRMSRSAADHGAGLRGRRDGLRLLARGGGRATLGWARTPLTGPLLRVVAPECRRRG